MTTEMHSCTHLPHHPPVGHRPKDLKRHRAGGQPRAMLQGTEHLRCGPIALSIIAFDAHRVTWCLMHKLGIASEGQ
jgi:hypothetical protein